MPAGFEPAPPARRRHPLLRPLPVALLGVAVLLACVGVPALLWSATGASNVIGTSGVGGALPSPSPVPATPEAYAQHLSTAEEVLTASFRRIGAAATMSSLASEIEAAGTAIDGVGDKFAAMLPPPAAAQGHQQALDALTRMEYEFESIDADRPDGRPCTGGAAVALLALSTPAELVRRAAATLKAADSRYVFGAFMPAATPLADRKLNNGTVVSRTTRGGSNQLKVVNNNDNDAAVTLTTANTQTSVLTVYVRGKSSNTVTGIRDGVYDKYLTSGKDWDSGTRRFTRGCDYSKFDQPSNLTSNRSSYTELTITLGAATGGGSPSSTVDPDSYPSA
jgi:hypothetical protein